MITIDTAIHTNTKWEIRQQDMCTTEFQNLYLIQHLSIGHQWAKLDILVIKHICGYYLCGVYSLDGRKLWQKMIRKAGSAFRICKIKQQENGNLVKKNNVNTHTLEYKCISCLVGWCVDQSEQRIKIGRCD